MRLNADNYLVHPAVMGRKVTVTAGLQTVRIYCDTAVSAKCLPENPMAVKAASRTTTPTRKALEELDFDYLRSLIREQIGHVSTLHFIGAKQNVIFLRPPCTGKRRCES